MAVGDALYWPEWDGTADENRQDGPDGLPTRCRVLPALCRHIVRQDERTGNSSCTRSGSARFAMTSQSRAVIPIQALGSPVCPQTAHGAVTSIRA